MEAMLQATEDKDRDELRGFCSFVAGSQLSTVQGFLRQLRLQRKSTKEDKDVCCRWFHFAVAHQAVLGVLLMVDNMGAETSTTHITGTSQGRHQRCAHSLKEVVTWPRVGMGRFHTVTEYYSRQKDYIINSKKAPNMYM